ncbi:MarR family transcriptional regulator [Paenibacillus mendelii]|uniref:MarR family transcriptional regulator n=1 Tax=Paenibacillus mendelii TaxID=206163 RepID=A0ABV6JFW2_9BACL|nr:MarR family transcriptional regulator [Paenibacillus mendelii]MCQ6557689.1 MarR family transcriptional regulator [Paenibacillus mendelii]
MDMKRCLFCDQIVPVRAQGDYEWFDGCYCATGAYYGLRKDSYDLYNELSYPTKAQMFPIISAYICELTDCEETVALSFDDLEMIQRSPRVPITVEDKSNRLLHYLHRHSKGPNEPVIIHRLPVRYNLTYSPNLQELIYIIERLREMEMIERAGSTFKLTEKGWREAAATVGGRRLKPCFVLIPDNEELRVEWNEKVSPKIEQCGYLPQLPEPSTTEMYGDHIVRLVTESKLLIADLTEPNPEVYYAAGLALGLQIPVIWTIKRGESNQNALPSKLIRPVVWDKGEELAAILEQRLTV